MFCISRRCVLLTALLLLFAVIVTPLALAEQTDAAAAIASAKEHVVACYQAARDAEGAGANISSLTAVLNDAGALLSSAESAYSIGDFDVARDFAVQSDQRLDGFVSAANALREAALQQRNFDFWVFFVGSIVGTFAVLGFGYALWFFLSRRYGSVEARESEFPGV